MGEALKIDKDARGAAAGAQCVHRSLGVMRLLAGSPPEGLRLVDIAAKLDLSHPTAHRILKALEEEGVVERVRGSRRYTIGAEALWLGISAANRFPIASAAAPELDRLAQLAGDSVFLTVPSQNDAVYAGRRFGSFPVQTTALSIGTRRPLGVTVAGRTIMAYLPQRRLQEVIDTNSPRYADFRCSPEMVADSAGQARAQGFLCANSLTAPKKRVLAVPVLDIVGKPVAALSVIAHESRLPGSRLSGLVAELKAAASEISERLTSRACSA